jgi:hypothetical protein
MVVELGVRHNFDVRNSEYRIVGACAFAPQACTIPFLSYQHMPNDLVIQFGTHEDMIIDF